jgi:hypothetical protein
MITLHKLFILLSACCTTATAQTYKPATFTDPDRLKKIEATYPVIDQIYKKYAEENHWPGVAYGIIVDGKLVHTVAWAIPMCPIKYRLRQNRLSALHL